MSVGRLQGAGGDVARDRSGEQAILLGGGPPKVLQGAGLIEGPSAHRAIPMGLSAGKALVRPVPGEVTNSLTQSLRG